MPRGAISCALTVVAAAATALCVSSSFSPVEAFAAPRAARRTTSTAAAAPLSATVHGGGDDDVVRSAGVIGRREALAAAAAATATAFVAPPAEAEAKEAAAVTPETVSAAFGAVRYQLESAETDGVPRLQSLIESENYPEVMEFTKLYDGAFRKGKMKPARKLLTDGKAKDDALMLSNAVTFDLIGINKNCRPGQESREGALKYLEELKADVRKFLELEGTIAFD